MSFENLNYYSGTTEKANHQIQAALVVYGATPAGITAAIQARKMGLEVVIAEFSKHLGGITANGLGATDFGAKEAIGGLSREFYKRLGNYYGRDEQWTFEPKAAQYVFKKWIEEYNIPVFFQQHLQKVLKSGKAIRKITMENGNTFIGKYFIDASYEGDLMAKAGITYYVGRESNATYNETYNGIQFGHPHHNFKTDVDPFVKEGEVDSGLLPGITEITSEVNGTGDKRIQAYNFRICLTKDPKKRIPFPKPPNYDPKRFTLLLRYIQTGVWDAMNLHIELPNGKTDLNNYGGSSTDHIGMNYDWPDGSYETRDKIFQDHLNYNLGMLYFLANDEHVPENVQKEVAEWGLPKDEFAETGHWPPQLYIRESRRMVSDYVMTDRNCLGQDTVEDVIGLASYQMDSHHCRRVLIDGKIVNEGDVEIPISPYPISYRALRPKETECTNLVVPVCLSSSHIAFGSIRMEPVFMILGQSAGSAVALAYQENIPVQQVDYNKLKQRLLDEDQVLEWDPSIEDDPVERMKETFGQELKTGGS
ncbi:FAD-dependent oxidoreductase [Aquibacillus sp. 3ASR75-11]|uniref:FAD-dependent oxidoreductase n=1 Tax=Terrihalobacillus insolitus TaxID=2950438 RepID=A0A9X4AKS6_9BACI|nr:FAD-dependent oxidoreductase [Terrihalobacillus insolitus]MDC3412163.1 FAD-dependent oxidoreductase [Terrihalobacillus insolitus]MDC3423144.1 FAD-dependent oxidoreductase [Terrihalobacillus insolitus]